MKCPCCGDRDGTRPMNLIDLGVGKVLLCDWCEESLIEGGTRKSIADRIKARQQTDDRRFAQGFAFVCESCLLLAESAEVLSVGLLGRRICDACGEREAELLPGRVSSSLFAVRSNVLTEIKKARGQEDRAPRGASGCNCSVCYRRRLHESRDH